MCTFKLFLNTLISVSYKRKKFCHGHWSSRVPNWPGIKAPYGLRGSETVPYIARESRSSMSKRISPISEINALGGGVLCNLLRYPHLQSYRSIAHTQLHWIIVISSSQIVLCQYRFEHGLHQDSCLPQQSNWFIKYKKGLARKNVFLS